MSHPNLLLSTGLFNFLGFYNKLFSLIFFIEKIRSGLWRQNFSVPNQSQVYEIVNFTQFFPRQVHRSWFEPNWLSLTDSLLQFQTQNSTMTSISRISPNAGQSFLGRLFFVSLFFRLLQQTFEGSRALARVQASSLLCIIDDQVTIQDYTKVIRKPESLIFV